MAEIFIRPAQLEDISGILYLLEQVNLVHHIGRPDLFQKITKYTKEELATRIGDEINPVFVAVNLAADTSSASNHVLGHIFCETQDHTSDPLFTDIKTLYVDDLCVDEDTRGIGVGRQLLEFVQTWGREHSYYNLTLGVWECNPSARKFYEAIGMKPQETIMETIL